MVICQGGETARQVKVGARYNGADRHRTAPAGEGHAAAPSQQSLVREEQPAIRVRGVRTCHSTTDDQPSTSNSGAEHLPTTYISAKCKSVWKQHAILPDTPGDLTSASKYFWMVPDPPGAKRSALRLCKSILRCSQEHLKLWRCIQDATRFDL